MIGPSRRGRSHYTFGPWISLQGDRLRFTLVWCCYDRSKVLGPRSLTCSRGLDRIRFGPRCSRQKRCFSTSTSSNPQQPWGPPIQSTVCSYRLTALPLSLERSFSSRITPPSRLEKFLVRYDGFIRTTVELWLQ